MLDVAIVGAGPAGLSAAAALLQCRSKPLRVEVSVARACEMLTMHKPLREMRHCFATDLHGRQLPMWGHSGHRLCNMWPYIPYRSLITSQDLKHVVRAWQ